MHGGSNFALNAWTFLPENMMLHFSRMCNETIAHPLHLPLIFRVWPSIPEIKSLLERVSVLSLLDMRGSVTRLVENLHWMVTSSVTTLGRDDWMRLWVQRSLIWKQKHFLNQEFANSCSQPTLVSWYHKVENCAVLCYYVASSGNSLQTFLTWRWERQVVLKRR